MFPIHKLETQFPTINHYKLSVTLFQCTAGSGCGEEKSEGNTFFTWLPHTAETLCYLKSYFKVHIIFLPLSPL